jgi:hypothetical protein
MKIRYMLPAMAVAALVAATSHQPAWAADNLAEMFTNGKAKVAFRYRFEFVDQDNFVNDAEASTLRGRVNFGTDAWNGWSAFGEFDYITDVIWDDYNAGAGNTPDKVNYPVVADPTGSDLNQAYIQWENTEGTRLRGGRQRIIFDNARFVGNVGWRQNEQTYDAGLFSQKWNGFDFELAYVWKVNRIFGNDVPAGEHDHSTALVNVSRAWEGSGKLTGYYYDIDNEDAAAASNRTYGIRWAGKTKWDNNAVSYTLEYASQDDSADNPVNYSADYYRGDLAVTFGGLTPSIGYESLGADGNRAGASFSTPLATLHAFNGWADRFLATPPGGLNDLFLGLKGGLADWTWNIIYHDFEAETGGGSYGDEIDASISRKFGEHYGLLFKAAFFDADSGSNYVDVTKLWVQFTANF